MISIKRKWFFKNPLEIVLALLLVLTFGVSTKAQDGPGGTGSTDGTSELVLWLKADGINTLNNGDPVIIWPDASGYNRNATDGSVPAASRPTYITNVINSKPIVRFDGLDDYLDDIYTYDARTVIIVYFFPDIAGQNNEDLGQLWGSYADEIHVAIDSRAARSYGYSFDGAGGNGYEGRFGLNGDGYSAFFGNGDDNANPDQFEIVAVEFDGTRTLNRQLLGSLEPNFDISEQNYEGDIAEIIAFDRVLNNAEKISIENYLSSKYSISITAAGVDYYSLESTHAEDVAGIGRVDASNIKASAGSSSLLEISNIAGLDADNEFLFFAHDGGNVTWTTNELPTSGLNQIQRIEREWRLDETGDVGTVKIALDTTDLLARPTADYTRFVLLVDDDGDFTDASIYEMQSVGGDNIYELDLDIIDGQYLSFGTVIPSLGFGAATQSDFETVDPNITISLNYIPLSDVNFNYQTADGTATGALVLNPNVDNQDYEVIASTPVTFNAGSNSLTFSLNVNNDNQEESDETVQIVITGLTAGVNALNAPLSYTIVDDDNLRKIFFDEASTTISETGGNVDIRVNITPSQVDPSNNTTVDYAVTGGTAANGDDYTLASGTLTIPINNISTTFPITLTDDAINEATETIVISLSNPTNGNLSTVEPIIHTVNITDNDPAPIVQFNTTSSTSTEDVANPTIPVVLSSISGIDVTVDYAVSGTMTGGGADFTLVNGTLTIPAGDISANIVPLINDDAEPEASETLVLTLSNPSITLGDRTVHTLTIDDNDGDFGFNGPGGVGGINTTEFWLKADEITGLTDGDRLNIDWPESSGNSRNASQSVTGEQPRYETNEFNGFPVISFDGINDNLENDYSYTVKTAFIVFRVSTFDQDNSQLGHMYGSYYENVHVAAEPRAGAVQNGFSFDGQINGIGGTARYALDGATYSGLIDNDNSQPWTYDQIHIVTVEFDESKPLTTQTIGGIAVGATANNYFGGDIAEIIVYQFDLNSARRNIVENYLAAKYNVAIPTDLYAFQSTHFYDVAGVGQEASGANDDAESDNLLRVNTVSGLDNGEYVLFGHDNGAVSWSATEVPADSLQRIAREWALDVTGTVNDATILIDPTDIDALPTDYSGYVLLTDDDGDFSNGGTEAYEMTMNGGLFEATNVPLAGDRYVTIATVGVTTFFEVLTASASEAAGTVNIAVELSVASASDTEITFAVDGSSTATEGGGADFTLSASPLIITAGNTSGNIVVTLNDDADIELEETVVLNLVSANNNVAVRGTQQFALTIRDNDTQNSGITGPGGVFEASSYVFWFAADSAVFADAGVTPAADNGTITQWNDLTGNNNHLSALGGAEPVFKDNATDNVNNRPVVDFGSGNVALTIGSNADINTSNFTEKTLAIAFKTGTDINNTQIVYEQGGSSNGLNVHVTNGNVVLAIWDNDWAATYYEFTALAIPNRVYIGVLEYDGATETINGYFNGELAGSSGSLGQPDFDAHGDDGAVGFKNNSTLVGGSDPTGDAYFEGQVLELLSTNTNFNDAQRVLVENYLSAKYDNAIGATGIDAFAFRATHGYDVAGIGQNNSEFHLAAKSDSILVISNPTIVNEGAFALIGNDNESIGSFVATDIPDADFVRLSREWRVKKVGDLGTFSFSYDSTSVSAAPDPAFSEYALLVDADGDFSAGTTVYTLTQNVGSFEASGISLNDGDYLAIGAFRPSVSFTLASDNASEAATPVAVSVSLNYQATEAFTVDFALDAGSSTAARGVSDDFDFADGTLTFDPGVTEQFISISINDDTDIESNETIVIDIANPSTRLVLGTQSTFTYTIEDNDQTNQIDFSVQTTEISEAAGSVFVTVKLNSTSASDIFADYTVTGTATGGGEDYTLASGTVTITAGNLFNTIQLLITDDLILENNETAIITLSNPVDASLGTNTSHTVTILDNDVAPELAFVTALSNGSEGNSPANIQVALSSVSGLEATVDYEVVVANTTATSGADFNLADGTLYIAQGDLTGTISIAILEDIILEIDEQIQIRLFDNGNLSNATIGAEDTLTYIINDNDAAGFTGPGGVRTATDYVFWLRSDRLVFTDNATNTAAANNQIADGWRDFSTTGNDASAVSGFEPVYKNNLSDNVNQKPVLDFSTGDQEMNIANADDINDSGPYTNKTIVAAFQLSTETEERQGIYEQGGGTNGFGMYVYQDSLFVAAWENLGTGTDEAFDTLSYPVSPGQTIIAVLDYNSTGDGLRAYVNGIDQGAKASPADGIPTHGGDITIGNRGDAPFHGSGNNFFEGKVMELITFNGNLSEIQRIILENYLAAKYNASIADSGNDFFAYQGTHSFGVAGLGKVDASTFKTSTQSDSTITISNASNLDDGEYFIFGHDDGLIDTYVTTEAPAGLIRLTREWRVDQTGDVGTVNISIDTTSFTGTISSIFTERVLLVDSDGNFSSGSTIVPLTQNGSAYEASNVDLSDGSFFTYAIISPEVSFRQLTSNGPENLTPAEIAIDLNYPLGLDLSFDVTQTAGSATEGVDYNFTDATLTIPAGNTTINAEIEVLNDSEVESDETVELTLSNPTLGQLGAHTVHTYSINDEDNFRKANFVLSDSSDTEDETIQGITVFLNAADNINPTEVYLSVTGGTALNDSIDYFIQALDTLVFVPGDTLETLPINIIEDLLDEEDEDIVVSIIGGSNATVGDTSVFTFTIIDNDLPPTVQFTEAARSGDESFQTVELAIELSGPSGKDIPISFTNTGGTATLDDDFQIGVNSIVIPAGTVTDSLRVTIIDDGLEEVPDETVDFTLSDPSPNATIGTNATVTYTILDNDGAGFRGPGGVGNLSAQTALWLRADDDNSGFSNGATVASWIDQTDNSNDGFQIDNNSQPVFLTNQMNNRPALSFDGSNDLIALNDTEDINIGGPYDKKTIYVAFRTSTDVTSRQMLYEEGGGIRGLSIYILDGTLYIGGYNQIDDDGGATTPWPASTPPFTINIQRAVSPNTNYFVVLQYDFEVDGAGFNGEVRGGLNGEALTALAGGGRLFNHPDDIGIGATNGGTVYHDISSSSTRSPFTGVISEVIVTNIVYNEAQRRIVYNYLGTKYDIDISTEDIYDHQGDHSYDIVGIGRTDAANTHNDAQGTGIIRINNPSALSDNEFLLIGHNNETINSWVSTEVPDNNTLGYRRVSREWRADMVGDVGGITMTLSASDFSSPPVGFEENYAVLVDDDGDFTTGAAIYQMSETSPGSGEYSVNNIDLSGDRYFTFALISGTVEFEFAAVNELEDNTPGAVNVLLSYIANDPVTVDYTVTDGTAQGGGIDYLLADGTLTFNSGQNSRGISIPLTQDAGVEGDETFTITLSNPSGDVELGTNSVLTFTINDSDQTRIANLANADSTNTEDNTPILIDVFLSERDDANTISINYAVTGTATNGSGQDFELATPGTLTFIAGDTLETISININDDLIDEPDETVVITLTGATNAGLGDTTTFTYTIQDNDVAPEVQFSGTTLLGSEATSAVTVPLILSQASTQTVTVNYTVDVASTATGGGTDYNLVTSSLEFPVGATSGEIDITVFNDLIIESDETIIINLNSATNATLGANTTLTYTIIDDDGGLGPIGPGGVGKSLTGAEMSIWLRADFNVFSDPAGTTAAVDSDPVFFWTDQSGQNNNAYDTATSTTSPTFLLDDVNRKPSIDFDRTATTDLLMDNDELINTEGDGYSLKTTGVVFQVSANVTDRQVVYEQGGGGNGMNIWIETDVLHFGAWSNTNSWNYIEVTTPILANELVYANFELDVLTGEIRVNGYKSTGGAFTGNTSGVTALLAPHGGEIGIGAVRNDTRFPSGTVSGEGEYFDGKILEIYQFNEANTNTFQQKLLASYYEGKYGVPVTTQDIYPDANDATHPHDIFGIGRDDASNRHTVARSSDQFLQFDSPDGVADGEYLVVGHDSASVATYSNTELTTNLQPFAQRIDREWLVEESGDIGNFRIMIDTTMLPANPVGFEQFFLIVDNDGDGDFSDDIDGDLVFHRLDERFGAFALVEPVNLADGDVFTIGMAINTAINDGDWNDPNTWLIGVPTPDEPVTINSVVTLDTDISVSAVTVTVAGTLNLGNGGHTLTLGTTMTVDAGGTFNAGNGTVDYAATTGDHCVEPVTYFNLIISGSGTRTLCGDIQVDNDITVNGNPVLNTDGTGDYDIDLYGNWATAINSTFTANQGIVRFLGSNAQTVGKTGSAETFSRVELNKPAEDLTINSGGVAISDSLALISGDLILGNFTLFINNSAAEGITGGGAGSYIQADGTGVVDRLITNGVFNTFPVGDNDEYSPVNLTLNSGTGIIPRIQVNVTDNIHPSLTPAGSYITRFWTVESTGLTSPNYDISYQYTDADIVGDENDFVAVKYNSFLVSDVTILNAAANLISWPGVTSFSDFTAGDNTALPVELISFTATLQDDETLLEWATASELNNDRFEIERSVDGVEFDLIGVVSGNGTTDVAQEYSFIDEAPRQGLNYYRLKQIDFDGAFEYSEIAFVDYSDPNVQFKAVAYPNPTSEDQIFIRLSSGDELAPVEINVVDLNGRVLFTNEVMPEDLRNSYQLNVRDKLANGVYMILVRQRGQSQQLRLMIR
ncbi:MAG: Calx-beta domain-containing protein [Bacteroidota bacterium]